MTADSRLLMRRNVRERAEALAPFLTFDPDPYIIIGDDGRLSWMLDAFTTSDTYPYSRHYRLGRNAINYVRNSVKAVVDAYDGTTTFYVIDPDDPIIVAYRAVFPSLFKDIGAMPPFLRTHVRYPELLLELQAMVYGLYHMTVPEVFYNRGLAYAGIPVTHREINSAVTFVTGHDASGLVPDAVDWASLAKGAPVLVIYMALKHIEQIVERLIAGGRRPSEPVAIVAKATTAEQRVLETTLARAADDAAAAGIEPPAMVVVGDVVRLRAGLDWLGALTGRALIADPLGLTHKGESA